MLCLCLCVPCLYVLYWRYLYSNTLYGPLVVANKNPGAVSNSMLLFQLYQRRNSPVLCLYCHEIVIYWSWIHVKEKEPLWIVGDLSQVSSKCRTTKAYHIAITCPPGLRPSHNPVISTAVTSSTLYIISAVPYQILPIILKTSRNMLLLSYIDNTPPNLFEHGYVIASLEYFDVHHWL